MLKGKRREKKIKKLAKERVREGEKELEKKKKEKIGEIVTYLNDLSAGLLLEIDPGNLEFRYFSIGRDSFTGEVFEADNLECKGKNFSLKYTSKKDKDEVLFNLKAIYNSDFGEIVISYITDPQYGYIDRERFESLVPKGEEIAKLLERVEEKTDGDFSKSFGDPEHKPVLQKSAHLDGRIWTKVVYNPGKGPFAYSQVEKPRGETQEEIFEGSV